MRFRLFFWLVAVIGCAACSGGTDNGLLAGDEEIGETEEDSGAPPDGDAEPDAEPDDGEEAEPDGEAEPEDSEPEDAEPEPEDAEEEGEEESDAPPHERTAWHEQQFASDPDAAAHYLDTVVVHLEAAGDHLGDTMGEGSDVIPYHYPEPVLHTICFEDEEEDPHYVVIRDAEGTEIETIHVGECQTVRMPAGDYTKEIHHASAEDEEAEPEIVFIRPRHPAPADGEETEEEEEPLPFGGPNMSIPPPPKVDTCSLECSVARSATYAGLSLDTGEAAVVTGSCPPLSTDTLSIYSANCYRIGHAVTGLIVGKQSQLITFSGNNLGGQPQLYASTSGNDYALFCLNQAQQAITGAESSFNLSSFAPSVGASCRAENVGFWCHYFAGETSDGQADVCPATPQVDSRVVPLAGQVTVIGPIDASSQTNACCSLAYRFSERCDDLSILGFDDSIHALLLGDESTEALLYHDAHFGGLSTLITSAVNAGLGPRNSYYRLPPATSSINAGEGTISSLDVRSSAEQAAITIISTRRCENCNLVGANLSHQMLNNVDLFGSNLTRADLRFTQLVGAGLSNTTLIGVKASYANLSQANLSNATIGSSSALADMANFTSAFMKDTILTGANARYAKFQSVNFLDSGTGVASLRNAQLDFADFSNATLLGVDCSGATLAGTDFSRAILIRSRFIGIVNNGNSQINTNKFTGAVLYGTDFTNSAFDYADFSNALFSFDGGTYSLTQVDTYNVPLSTYTTVTNDVVYSANYPDKMPSSTTSHTTCPDNDTGPCLGNGGESPTSCPADCGSQGVCENDWNCLQSTWSVSTRGHWTCNSLGACVTCADPVNCGDHLCDWIGGETISSCPSDCTTANSKTCVHPSQCLAKSWTGSLVGHWECQSNTCVKITSGDTRCGNGVCEPNGRFLPLQPPQYTGKNNLNGWTRPSQGICQ